VAGAVQGTASSVTVNGSAATLYADQTFAQAGVSLTDGTNTFTAVATDTLGRWDTNTVTAYLPATVTFAYDLNGNLRTNGTRLLDYDDENQLIRITEPGAWLSEFVYDGKMRRRLRREYVWQSAIWNLQSEIRYVYDGNLVIQERHYAPQLSTNSPQQIITYTRGRDLSDSLEGAGGIGGLLARSHSEISNPQSGNHALYHADGNGNVTCLLATNQSVVARYLYDPYGNPLAATGPLAEANLYRFSSKEWHPQSGLVYYGYRFYDPSLQRWVNRDPLQELGGINLYATTHNNPVSLYDFFGLLTAEEQACLDRAKQDFRKCVQSAQGWYAEMLDRVLSVHQGCCWKCEDWAFPVRPICYVSCRVLLISQLMGINVILLGWLQTCAVEYGSMADVCLQEQRCNFMVGPGL
jgi:RHS repeat-associated protein